MKSCCNCKFRRACKFFQAINELDNEFHVINKDGLAEICSLYEVIV